MAEHKLATFAGGCFWCMVQPFANLTGVSDVISGYTGGRTCNPTYEEVCGGRTGHYEAVQLTYDPGAISYEKLLDTFWRQIDPIDPAGQFADKGQQYRTAIFYHDDEQKRLAQASKKAMESSGMFTGPIATQILPASDFYSAEDYHQDYYMKNPHHYKSYKSGSGREAFLRKTWHGDAGESDRGSDRESILKKIWHGDADEGTRSSDHRNP